MQIELHTITSEGIGSRPMFHPKVGRHPSGRLFMSLQTIGSGDFYGPVETCISDDNGYTWSKPVSVPTLGWAPIAAYSNAYEGTCDTVVDYDPATGAMLFIGHNVFYRNGRHMDTLGHWGKEDYAPELKRRGVYSALNPDGTWAPRQIFEPPEFAADICFVCGCGQRIVRPDGDWLIAFYGQELDHPPFCFVTVYRARFDGASFALLERGNILTHRFGRGLLEPSLMEFQGEVRLTLRAEDGKAYHSRSADGLHYAPIQPWRFDDGTDLETSSTQQHFLCTDDRLFLSYTRKNEVNAKVVRFRAPLYIAEVEPRTMTLLRSTEQVVFPIDGDPARPDTVHLSGNFMPTRLGPNQWIITDGQSLPVKPFSSPLKIAHIAL